MENTHHYEVDIHWSGKFEGELSSPLVPLQIPVAIPDDFPNGIKGVWSPEHLLIAAVNSCIMVTFITIAANSKIPFIRYDSNVKGIVEKLVNGLKFTSIIIVPTVVITTGQDDHKIRHLFEMTEKACAISNSLSDRIKLEPLVVFEPILSN